MPFVSTLSTMLPVHTHDRIDTSNEHFFHLVRPVAHDLDPYHCQRSRAGRGVHLSYLQRVQVKCSGSSGDTVFARSHDT